MKNLLAGFVMISATFMLPLKIQAQTANEAEQEDENILCGGTERWSQKVLTDAAASTINFIPVITSITNLVNIVTPTPSSSMLRYAGVEDKTYSVVCNIAIKKFESDNDYHLVLTDGVSTLIGEIPDPYCSAASSSTLVNSYILARNFVDKWIAFGNVYNVSLPKVVVYGVAFIDPPHGQTGAASNNLEIHPILNIHFLDPTVGLNKEEGVLKIDLFPNPADNYLILEMKSKTDAFINCDFLIYSLQGVIIKRCPLPNAINNLKTKLSIEELSSGTYYYRITKEGGNLFEGKFTKL